MLLTAQVVRCSVGSPNVMVGDRLELGSCDQYQGFFAHFSSLHLSTYEFVKSALSLSPVLYLIFSQFARFGWSC